jgi:CRISPR/Cas system-associated endoribonuclease Cas2
LENYHSYFNKVDNSIFEGMLNLVVISETSRTDDDDDDEKAMLIGTPLDATQESKLIHILVVRSIQAAYKHALISSDCQSKAEFKHPLIILANELKLVAEKECTIFSPTLCKRYPEAGRVALVLLHLLYGQQLVSLVTPF